MRRQQRAAGPRRPDGAQNRILAQIVAASIVFAVVTVASLVGIAARGAAPLSTFYPANAILVGVLFVSPRVRRAGSWGGAAAGYLAADLVTGSEFSVATWLTVSNMAGVVVVLCLLRRLRAEDRWLERPVSMGLVSLACVSGAAAASIPGTYTGVTYFDLEAASAAVTWFAAETATYLALLPPILVARYPTQGLTYAVRRWRAAPGAVIGSLVTSVVLPISLLVVCLVVGSSIDVEAGLAFALPVLLWSALRGGAFQTAMVVLAANVWYLLGVSFDADFATIDLAGIDVSGIVAVQIAMAVLSLAILMAAVASHQRVVDIARMEYLASRDPLTGLLNRRAFLHEGQRLLDSMHVSGRDAAVLMLDLDNFKAVNDNHGHAVGDRLLAVTADALLGRLRDHDVLGRLGGEEFTAVIGGISVESAEGLGESLRRTVSGAQVRVGDGIDAVGVTVSIGLAHHRDQGRRPVLLDLLVEADAALYAAKRLGRDRLVVSPDTTN